MRKICQGWKTSAGISSRNSGKGRRSAWSGAEKIPGRRFCDRQDYLFTGSRKSEDTIYIRWIML